MISTRRLFVLPQLGHEDSKFGPWGTRISKVHPVVLDCHTRALLVARNCLPCATGAANDQLHALVATKATAVTLALANNAAEVVARMRVTMERAIGVMY